MNLSRIIAIPAVTLALSACGSDFEWFPKVEDTFPPKVTASAEGRLFQNQTTHVSALPATVTFSANEAATIYYTTSGLDPTTTSAAVEIRAENSTADISITLTSTILKFFGIDKAPKKNQSAIQTFLIKSP